MKILNNINDNRNVIINTDLYTDLMLTLIDSISKLWSERYGLRVYNVESIEDINNFAISDFSIDGYNVFTGIDSPKYYSILKKLGNKNNDLY